MKKYKIGMYLTNSGKLVEFYVRIVKESVCTYTSQLVYTSDNKVTDGFTRRIICR